VAIATPSYYIPKAIVTSILTLVVGYYTSKPVPILNPTAIYWLEQLCNLEQKPSHRFSFQQHVEWVNVVVVHVLQQTQPIIQGVWSSVSIMGIVERPPIQRSISITNS
jgi:hypothetical protein